MTKIILAVLSISLPALAFPPGWDSIDPDHDPSWKTKYKVDVDNCSFAAADKSIWLNKKNPKLEEILEFLELAAVAKTKITAFRRLYAAGEISIGYFSPYSHKHLIQSGVVATFEFIPSENKKTIYVDFSGELGVVAIHFYHEMIHSLDVDGVQAFTREYEKREAAHKVEREKIWDKIAARVGKPKEEIKPEEVNKEELAALNAIWAPLKKFKNDGTYYGEHLAFSEQMKLLPQLTARISCYRHYIKQQQDQNEINLWIDDIEGNLAFKYGVTKPKNN